jgi:type I restriction enzyme, S subunit
MIDNWKKRKIIDIAEFMGDAPFGTSIKNQDYTESGALVVQGKNISGQTCNWSDRRYVSIEKYNSLPKSHCSLGDLIFPKVGTIGKVGFLTPFGNQKRYILSTNTMCLRPNEKFAHNKYVYYYFASPKVSKLIQTLNANSVQPVFNFTSLRDFEIILPPLPEQRAIAHILGSLDDKIELNRRMNETLESIARALFKSWFVDFDPVRAKMEGRQPYGMDAETAALFLDGFEDSGLGEIPRGWRVIKLGEVASINELSLTKDFPYEEIEYIDISSVSVGKLEGTTRYALNMAPSRAKRLVRHGDTIWSTVRPNRKSYSFIHTPLENLVVSTGFAVLTPKSIPSTYLYTWVTTDQFVDYLVYNSDGSAYPAVLSSRFSESIMLLPKVHVLQKFDEMLSPMRNLIFQNDEESQTLTALRDTLLPKLLSGEIRVKDAERAVEAAV